MDRSSPPSKESVIAPTYTADLCNEAVTKACELLRQGEAVILPTETVYGLAANALDPLAVRRLFEIKERPANNPLIVHVHGMAMARSCASHWPSLADALGSAFWPGPLTLVVARSERIPDEVVAGGDTVAIRWPSHPIIQKIIERCGFPLAAPSANLSTETSPTNARHASLRLQGKVKLVVDGGPCQVGIESTVLDLTTSPPRILRPGMIGPTAILSVTGALEPPLRDPTGPIRSPGMVGRHYAPKSRLIILSWEDAADLEGQLRDRRVDPLHAHIVTHTRIPSAAGFGRVAVIPHDAQAYARAIYAELYHCDQLGASCIVIEALPEEEAWAAVADRLRRASE